MSPIDWTDPTIAGPIITWLPVTSPPEVLKIGAEGVSGARPEHDESNEHDCRGNRGDRSNARDHLPIVTPCMKVRVGPPASASV